MASAPGDEIKPPGHYYDIIKLDMINFKISDLSSGLITVTKPAGKSISLNIGEVVKADVVDLLETGGVTMKIKDSYLTARTDVQVQKDSQILLKVLASPTSPNELRLQFLGYSGEDQAQSPANAALGRLVRDLSGAGIKNLSSEDIASLIKALPQDVGEIPQDLRLQLQDILREGLQSTGKDIQSRIDAMFRDLPQAFKGLSFIQGLQLDVAQSAERLLSDGLRGLLRDTGVALEAKLKSVAEALQTASGGGRAGTEEASGISAALKSQMPMAEKASIDNDLKTNLLRLRETLNSALESMPGKDTAQVKAVINSLDGMLKDIESYQLMSKATGSFYTFLPVNWQELKDGDIAFQTNEDEEAGGRSRSSSCRLSLDLEGFGKLNIMVLMHNNEFFVSFKAEKAGFRELISSNLGNLDEQFREKGLNLKSARALDNDEIPPDSLENSGLFRRSVNIRA
jgi:hypothetical protein